MKQEKRAKITGVVTTQDKMVTVDLFVIQFEDGGCQIAYCPALNIYGYGTSEDEARHSFEINMGEFFDYTIKKKTLVKELESLGWTVKKAKKFSAPPFTKLLQSNRDLKKIMDTREFRKINAPISMPAFS